MSYTPRALLVVMTIRQQPSSHSEKKGQKILHVNVKESAKEENGQIIVSAWEHLKAIFSKLTLKCLSYAKKSKISL